MGFFERRARGNEAIGDKTHHSNAYDDSGTGSDDFGGFLGEMW